MFTNHFRDFGHVIVFDFKPTATMLSLAAMVWNGLPTKLTVDFYLSLYVLTYTREPSQRLRQLGHGGTQAISMITKTARSLI